MGQRPAVDASERGLHRFEPEPGFPFQAEQYVEAAAAEVGIDQGTPAAPPIQFGGQHGRHRAGAESAADGCDRDQIGAQRGGGQRRRTNAPAAADRG